MSSSVTNSRDPSILRQIPLAEGEALNVEPEAMLACKNIEMKTGLNGSIMAVAKRYLLGGESLFQNSYWGGSGGGWSPRCWTA